MERLTKREGKHAIRIGNEWRRHDPVWDRLAEYEDTGLSPEVLDYCITDNIQASSVYCTKIVDGSVLCIGGKFSSVQLKVDQHFNWFQKLMWKWCFGVNVEDYKE